MKNFKLLPIALMFFTTSVFSFEIFSTQLQKTITPTEFLTLHSVDRNFVLGEFHNTQPIQNGQARLIELILTLYPNHMKSALHWEFLNHTDQNQITLDWKKVINSQMSSETFLTEYLGDKNKEYLPIFSLLSKSNTSVYGLNIPRSIKQDVIKNGIGSIDQTLIPDHHYIGGPEYKERFTKAMGGHAPSDLVDKYFEVQCLTDSIMADQFIKYSSHAEINFIIAGSFHTDYFDGTVTRINQLTTDSLVTFKFIQKSAHTTEELKEFKTGSKTYGHYADYIIIVSDQNKDK